MEAAAATTVQHGPAGGPRRAAELWHAALARLSGRISGHVVQTWLVPVLPVDVELTGPAPTLVLGVPHQFHADWLRDHYADVLAEEIARDLPGARVRCSVMPELEGATTPPPSSIAPVALSRAEAAQSLPPLSLPPMPAAGATLSPAASSTATAPSMGPRVQTRFNPRLSFDNYIVGPSNQLAVAASRAVADKPGQQYNPLFIFGAVGLGKTHLVQAIGQHVQRTRPELNVLYLSAEDFANEFITSMQAGRMDAFRVKYRAQCDVLLLDDVHFLAGKERTQEEFFHVFNHHHQLGRQVVVTSDRFPHEMQGVEERLRNRLQWGLIVDIQPPELETRMAILRHRAGQMGVVIPDDVTLFLASHIKTSVRELEGALTRLVAASSLHRRPVDIALCREELRDQVLSRARAPTCEEIQKHVCTFYDVSIVEMRGSKRHRGITLPRHVAMYLCRKHTQASFPEIGAAFGGKDHTTVMASVRKVEELVKTDPVVLQATQQLGRLVEG